MLTGGDPPAEEPIAAVVSASAEQMRSSLGALDQAARGQTDPDAGHDGDEDSAASKAHTKVDRALTEWALVVTVAIAGALTRRAAGLDTNLGSDLPGGPVRPVRPGVKAVLVRMRSLLTSDSVALQEAIRTAAGMGLAIVAAMVLSVDHGYWVAITTIVVLRAGVGGTLLIAVLQVAGVLIGFALSTLILAVADVDAVLLGVLILAMFAFAFSARALGPATMIAAMTVMLVMGLNLAAPVGWEIGAVRLMDVGIGALIGLAAAVLMWPQGARSLLARVASQAIRATSATLDTVSEPLLAGRPAPDASPRMAETRAILTRFEEALSAALSEPHRPPESDSYSELLASCGRTLATAHTLFRFGRPIPEQAAGRAELAARARQLHSHWDGLAGELAPGSTQTGDPGARTTPASPAAEGARPRGSSAVAIAIADHGVRASETELERARRAVAGITAAAAR
jgi:uncharacterized membrane protein YccC